MMVLRRLIAWCVLLLASTASCGWAEGLTWLRDFDAAKVRASDENKLLLSLQLGGDFLEDPTKSPELRAFERMALGDEALRTKFERRFVLHVNANGWPKNLQLDFPPANSPLHRRATVKQFDIAAWTAAANPDEKRSAKKHARPSFSPVVTTVPNAATFFCLPDGRVVHLLVGFPSTEKFFKAVTWTIATEQAIRLAGVDGEKTTLRDKHLAHVVAADRKLLKQLGSSDWQADGAKREDAASITRTVDVIGLMKVHRMRQRFGAGWTPAQQGSLLAALARHETVESELTHVLCSELPLVPVDAVQSLVVTRLGMQGFWHVEETAELDEWVGQQEGEEKLMLFELAIDEARKYKPSRQVEKLKWPPKRGSSAHKLLERVAVRTATLPEVAHVMKQFSYDPIPCDWLSEPRLVLLNPADKSSSVIFNANTVADAETILKARMQNQP